MAKLEKLHREVLAQRRIASLATIRPDGTPHVTAVWFLFDGDGFLIATSSTSVKAKNVRENPRIAVMVDVRQDGQGLGICASGVADIVEGETAREAVARVHEKYLTDDGLADPDVGPAFATVDDIAIRLVPKRWITWDMSALDQQEFGGKLAAHSYLRPIRA
ncbi:MAG TPA: PPOX class F420-dependent oxidoreductase [Thermoanaerobaculia bacterium]|nr:PPOX class F420-dependent oxidoreductase [Thermoanaerobaculia bacterium]